MRPLTAAGTPWQIDRDVSVQNGAEMEKIAADPAKLRKQLAVAADPTALTGAFDSLFNGASILTDTPPSPKARAAFFRTLAEVPGIRPLAMSTTPAAMTASDWPRAPRCGTAAGPSMTTRSSSIRRPTGSSATRTSS